MLRNEYEHRFFSLNVIIIRINVAFWLVWLKLSAKENKTNRKISADKSNGKKMSQFFTRKFPLNRPESDAWLGYDFLFKKCFSVNFHLFVQLPLFLLLLLPLYRLILQRTIRGRLSTKMKPSKWTIYDIHTRCLR